MSTQLLGYSFSDVLAPLTVEGFHALPALEYAYGDLEPLIDAETMMLHHEKHHRAYVDGLNAAIVRAPGLKGLSLVDVLLKSPEAPEGVRQSLLNMGGGHFNHSFFWSCIGPSKAAGMRLEVQRALEEAFGSVNQFMRAFESTGVGQFGSGWVWLCADRSAGNRLEVIPLPNQDTPLGFGKVGLLACDVWEHAYYLKYRNRRAEWLKQWWQVVDWERLALRVSALQESTGTLPIKADAAAVVV